MLNTEKLVKSFPPQVKWFLKYFYGAVPVHVRYGKLFWKTYNFLQDSQWWSRTELEEYQMIQLNKLLRHAYENVPYYRKVFRNRGIEPSDINDIDDLKKLPCLDKDTFRLHFNEIVARNFKLSSMRITHTSGTTGKPLQFYQDPQESLIEWAFICHQWARVGYKPGDPRVEIRGPIKVSSPVELDQVNRVLRLSPRIDNKQAAQYYIDRIKAFGTRFLHGYPSAIASFAYIIKRYSISVPFKLKAVLFASEVVYDWERKIVEEVFNCRAFSHYGLTEHVALGAECEYSTFYHFLPQYSIVEIDPHTHEIIGTSLLNYVNPFIRYKTTDIAESPILSECKHCGRNYFPILKGVQGRLGDYIVLPNGTLISPAAITHPFKDLKTIRDTQIVQESEDEITLRIVPWKGTTKASMYEVRQLSNDLQKILGENVQIKIEIVDEIERTKSGKFKWIVSKVSKGLMEKGLESY